MSPLICNMVDKHIFMPYMMNHRPLAADKKSNIGDFLMMDHIDDGVIVKVRALYAQDDDAKRFLDWCAGKRRDAQETSIDNIMRVTDVSRSTAVALAKALDEAGCGEFIVGRRGSSSRFAWNYSRINLGHIAAGEAEELEAVIDPIDDEDEHTNEVTALTIPQAKRYLAQSLGVTPEQIEIHIKA
jgi:hypothetical protein